MATSHPESGSWPCDAEELSQFLASLEIELIALRMLQMEYL